MLINSMNKFNTLILKKEIAPLNNERALKEFKKTSRK